MFFWVSNPVKNITRPSKWVSLYCVMTVDTGVRNFHNVFQEKVINKKEEINLGKKKREQERRTELTFMILSKKIPTFQKMRFVML